MNAPAQREAVFGKTVLMINAEHTAATQTTTRPRYVDQNPGQIFWTNTYVGQQWYGGGPGNPLLQRITENALREFSVTTYFDPNPEAPAGECLDNVLPCVATSEFYHYFHTDGETPDQVPWTGLETTTRAYARIIDEVNKLDRSDLHRPVPAAQQPQ
jgi:hypothetical protein